jgi:hypothetical protein
VAVDQPVAQVVSQESDAGETTICQSWVQFLPRIWENFGDLKMMKAVI